ncbi:DUF2851 family protein [uncultured Polaribacter sp.]|uniref:DUF2851 family protein n=1 Tax=uncultured Polaribacter sp. TaxID=174711 RepID=UPI0026319686|nr:DUF2851 family protein [uncultured Polaribacter sp.]
MKEDFLHYIWKYKLFSLTNLETVNKEVVTIVNSGIHNKNAGPDFLNAQLKLDNQLWAGNVEIHIKSSDWYAHNHETDANYDNVILHVVWENDANIYMKNNQPLPTLVLNGLVSNTILQNYNSLLFAPQKWIPCEDFIKDVDSFTLSNWKERLFFDRLERKATTIKQLLAKENNDFEAVLFQLLAKNFGLKINGDAFLRLAQSVDFAIIKKCSFKGLELAALLFGQAGFLETSLAHEYHATLKKEYNYLKHKFGLESMSKNTFSFFRMRPNNFPTIRIAQLIGLFHKHQNLFSKVLAVQKLDDFYTLFSIDVASFWKTHYNFESTSKTSAKKLTKSFIDLLIINTIIPLKFLYEQARGEVDETFYLELLENIKPEKNSIITKFEVHKIFAKNAFDTQALLELKNNYCLLKRCLECAIGVKVLGK